MRMGSEQRHPRSREKTRKWACLKHWKPSSLPFLLSPVSVRDTQLFPCMIFFFLSTQVMRDHISALHIFPFGVLTFIGLRQQQGVQNDRVKLGCCRLWACSVSNELLPLFFLIKMYMRDQHEGKLSMWEMVLQQSMLECLCSCCLSFNFN